MRGRQAARTRRVWVGRLALPVLSILVIGGGVALAAFRAAPAVVPLTTAAWPSLGEAAAARPTPTSQPRPSLGDPAAPVAIVEYADYQCPFCGAFAREVQPQIESAYVKSGKVRFEWRDFAWMGAESKVAANAARCAADQGAFWKYHDRLYASPVAPNRGTFTRARLIADAAAIGLDTETLGACVDDGRHRVAVEADTAEATRLGMSGTPTFVIDGQRIVGAQPFATFAAAIDAALARANAR